MCFSAEVSITAGTFLIGTGVVALAKIDSPKMAAFASIPLLFGIQQLAEGGLWLSFSNPELLAWEGPLTYFFVFIAEVIWPFWVAFSLWMVEPDERRKKILSYFMVLGALAATLSLFFVLTKEVTIISTDRHIKYHLGFPLKELRDSLYLLTTLVPLFLSTLRYIKLLGSAIIGALSVTYLFYANYAFSIWCFFAAIVSVLVIIVVVYNRESMQTARKGMRQHSRDLTHGNN